MAWRGVVKFADRPYGILKAPITLLSFGISEDKLVGKALQWCYM
jgi:hypothetical protein